MITTIRIRLIVTSIISQLPFSVCVCVYACVLRIYTLLANFKDPNCMTSCVTGCLLYEQLLISMFHPTAIFGKYFQQQKNPYLTYKYLRHYQ